MTTHENIVSFGEARSRSAAIPSRRGAVHVNARSSASSSSVSQNPSSKLKKFNKAASSRPVSPSRVASRDASLDPAFTATLRSGSYSASRKGASASRSTAQTRRESSGAIGVSKVAKSMPQSSHATAQPKRSTARPAPKASSNRVQMPSFSEAAERAQSAAQYSAEQQQAQVRKGSTETEKNKKSLTHKVRAAKAERQFNKRFAGDDASKAAPQETSRPALYEMKMGKNHKRSSKMQDGAKGKSRRKIGLFSGLYSRLDPRSPRFSSQLLIGCAVVVLTVCLLYQPVANYYNEVRQQQQLEAEYEVVSDYYSSLKSEVEYLNTDEGMEDFVRQELGWVKRGENVVSVEGLAPRDATTRTGSITADLSSSVPTPSTWYSGVLDIVFGYNKP